MFAAEVFSYRIASAALYPRLLVSSIGLILGLRKLQTLF